MTKHIAGRSWHVRALSSAILALAALTFAPKPANATLMSTYWTSAQGSGFIAYSAAYTTLNLTIESDVLGGWYGTSVTRSYAEINTHIAECNYGWNYTIDTQHTATDPSTSEYEWESSGASGTCN